LDHESEITTMERRTRRRVPRTEPGELRLSFDDHAGLRQVFAAAIADLSDGGVGVLVPAPLEAGQAVAVRPGPGFADLLGDLPPSAKVCWCTTGPRGGYRAGLVFDVPRPRDSAQPAAGPPVADYYELLQVNPKAEPETIHRVFRLLAQRYHPDNGETGNDEMFKLVLSAYRVLSDPEQRAAYDILRAAEQHSRRRVLDRLNGQMGPAPERHKRKVTLLALYYRRVQQPDSPALSVFELEDILGAPREHLEFTFWYLKESGLVSRSDNNRFQITLKGVDAAEEMVAESGARQEDPGRELPAPAHAARR
jgi:curved DNA-binding protein CbpA